MKLPMIGQGVGNYKWDESHIRLLRTGIGLGMNFIDTAEIYDDGKSEIIVGKAVQGLRDQTYIGSKFSPENSEFEGVIRSAESSLLRLQTDYLDLYQLHWPHPDIPIESTCAALMLLREQGKIHHIGLCNVGVDLLDFIHQRVGVSTLQVEYNLFDRFIESNILPYCQQNDITVIAYSPLDQGRIADGDLRLFLAHLANKYARSPSQIALSWIVAHSGVVVIPKSTTFAHLQENASAAELQLDEEDIKQIDEMKTRIQMVDPNDIRVTLEGQNNKMAYQTMEEALANKLDFVPSPASLATSIVVNDIESLKPVRLIRSSSSVYAYELVEGRIRYWAWVIACGGLDCARPIPAYIREDWK